MANPWGDEPVSATPEATPSAPVNPWGDAPVAAPPAGPQGFMAKVKDVFTGESRTDPAYAGKPEFLDAYADTPRGPNGELPNIRLDAVQQSAVAPTEEGQLDILKKQIPSLETKHDAHGNLLLKAPGMKEFTYLNAPGASKRDLDEFGTQTLATLPFMGMAGAGTGLAARLGLGATGMAAGSVAQDALAGAAGSEQGISPERAAVSGALGAALPAGEGVLRGAIAAAKYPLNRIQAAVNPDAAAHKAVQSAVAADRAAPRGAPLNAQEVTGARAAGQDLRVADLGGGEATRGLARSAANQSPEARSMLLNVIDERFAGQGPRTEEFVRSLVARPGQNVNAYETKEALQVAARAARRPLYDKAYDEGKLGLMTPLLSQLARAPAMERARQAAAVSLRNRAATGNTTGIRGPNGYTLEFWDHVKRNLDDSISTLKRQGAKSAALELDELRRPLVKELDTLIPSYSAARGTAQSFFKATDALEAGENFVAGRFKEDAARAALSKMTPQERELFAEGFTSRFIQNVRETGDRRSILNAINASPAARGRLSIALGPNRARSMEAFLRVEGLMDTLRNAVAGNSTTARQLVEMGLIGGGAGYSAYNLDPHAALGAAMVYGNRAIDRRVAARVAQMLLSDNPQTFLQGLRQVGATPMMDALRNVDKALMRLGGGREGAQELSSGAPTSAPQPSVAPAPAPTGPGNILPRPPLPTPQAPEVPSVQGAPQRRAEMQPAQEAQRLAEDAIARGADRDAVMARLTTYLQTNGLDAA